MIVVTENLLDLSDTTVSAASVGKLVPENLKNDLKSMVWRAGGTSATITVNFGSPQWVSCVVLPFTNMTPTSTMTVNGIRYGVPPDIYNSQLYNMTATAVPADAGKPWDWGAAPTGANTFSYGGGNYARFTFPPVQTTSVTITLSDPGNPDGYIEAARLVVGNYWAPKYNADYGASVGVQDSSNNARSDAGDLISDRGYRHRTMSLTLSTLTDADRATFYRILRHHGKTRPMLVSLFPYNLDGELERDHMIYGKLSNLSAISMQFINMFSGTIEIEEV